MTEPTPHSTSPAKPKLSKAERQRRIRAIQADFEAKKRALGLRAPAFRRGPVFYLVIMAVMALLGLSLMRASQNGGHSAKAAAGRATQALKSVDAFAEALGRFKFHTGAYPTLEEGGLEALATKRSSRPGWMGPYIHKRIWSDPLPKDPWKRAYVYAPTGGTNGLPLVLSRGPDGVQGTADDVLPDPALFTKPFRDTTWTNDWAPHQLRGYIVVPSHSEQASPKRP